MNRSKISPLLLAVMSVVPGLGHWCLGKKRKAAAFFIIALGLLISLFLVKSPIGLILICLAYVAITLPAIVETYTLAAGGVKELSESRGYIIFLLIAVGITSLPLLWQSRVFSKRAKILWSIGISTVAVLYLSFLAVFGMRIFSHARSWFGS